MALSKLRLKYFKPVQLRSAFLFSSSKNLHTVGTAFNCTKTFVIVIFGVNNLVVSNSQSLIFQPQLSCDAHLVALLGQPLDCCLQSEIFRHIFLVPEP